LLLLECNTEFISIHERHENDHEAIGDWLIKGMRNAADYCVLHGITRPDIHVIPSMVPQHRLDTLAVEAFLLDTEIRRKSGEA
jgi:hypothetical protein